MQLLRVFQTGLFKPSQPALNVAAAGHRACGQEGVRRADPGRKAAPAPPLSLWEGSV